MPFLRVAVLSPLVSAALAQPALQNPLQLTSLDRRIAFVLSSQAKLTYSGGFRGNRLIEEAELAQAQELAERPIWFHPERP